MADGDEKKVGKGDSATVAIRVGNELVTTVVCRKENGDKIIARGSIFPDDCKATILPRQVLEIRREEGSVVFAVRNRRRWEMFNEAGIRSHVEALDYASMTNDEIVAHLMGLLGLSA